MNQNTSGLIGITLAALCLLLLSGSLLLVNSSTHAADDVESFDHFTTGFPLTGKHQFLDCSSCHIGGMFKGTPLECGLCHNRSRAPGKNPEHVPSSNICDDCHTTDTWLGARFDHSGIFAPCENCHNNSVALGKSPSHITTTTSSTCEDCHNTITFKRVGRVDHAFVSGTCDSCHNGIKATGKSPQHLFTIAQCDNCHNTNTWRGARFDHTYATGLCLSCHNGSIATGKSTTHFVTTLDCNRCHTTARWIPLPHFTHDSPDYPGDHRTGVLCVDCHTTNNQVIAWPFPAYQPECAACHTDDYVPDSHKGVGDVPLPISDVADCSGSCHLKDGIQSNEHRASAGSW